MILGELSGFSLFALIVPVEVDPTVSHIAEIEVFRCEPCQCQSSCHAFFTLILIRLGIDRKVDRLNGLLEVAEVTGTEARCRSFESPRDHRTELLKHEAGSHISGITSAHTIGNRKYEVMVLQ